MMFATMPAADISTGTLLPLEKEMRVIFYELGIVGVNNLMGYESLQLFTELHKAEPEAAYPLMGLGMVALATGDFATAKGYFTHPLVGGSPLAAYAQGLLAVAYKLEGNQGGFEEASLAAAESSGGELRGTLEELGKTVIDFSQR